MKTTTIFYVVILAIMWILKIIFKIVSEKKNENRELNYFQERKYIYNPGRNTNLTEQNSQPKQNDEEIEVLLNKKNEL
jgi:hypothetical protein